MRILERFEPARRRLHPSAARLRQPTARPHRSAARLRHAAPRAGPAGRIHSVVAHVRWLCILAGLCAAGAAARAQESTALPFESPLSGGRKALQFSVTQGFQLSSFSGSVLSYKVQRSPRSAVRISLSISGEDREDFASVVDSDGPDEHTRESEREITEFDVELGVQLLRYSIGRGRLGPYFGGGPSVSYGRSVREDRALGEGDSESTWNESTARVRSFAVSGLAVAGIEWIAKSWLSCHAEYGLRVAHRWLHSEVERASRRSPTSPDDREEHESEDRTEWTAGAASVRFGVSVYF